MNITEKQIAQLKEIYEGNREELKYVEDYIDEYGITDDGLTDVTASFEQGYNNALEMVFRILGLTF